MQEQTLYMNVYRAGFYHRQGKPNHTNLHGGDLFESRDLAEQNADLRSGFFLQTVPVVVAVPYGAPVTSNPPDSIPKPLAETRRRPVFHEDVELV